MTPPAEPPNHKGARLVDCYDGESPFQQLLHELERRESLIEAELWELKYEHRATEADQGT